MSRLRLYFAVVPRFNQDSDAPHDIIITEGESVTINCTADAKPEADVTWYRNGKRLNSEPH